MVRPIADRMEKPATLVANCHRAEIFKLFPFTAPMARLRLTNPILNSKGKRRAGNFATMIPIQGSCQSEALTGFLCPATAGEAIRQAADTQRSQTQKP